MANPSSTSPSGLELPTEASPLLQRKQSASTLDVSLAPGAPLPSPSLAPDATSPEENRRSLYKWLLFWFVVAVVFGVLVAEAFAQGGGEFDWKGALKKAGGGGLSGAMAMVLQVLTLMPLRTWMNYQYRYGGTIRNAIKTLYAEDGVKRYYAGLLPALVQGPVARFCDTAANAGILALLSSNPFLSTLPSPVKTAFASTTGALLRMVLVPIDTLKTTMQTQGRHAVRILRDRVKAYGVGSLWYGAWATAAASFVGSFPWFATYNWLSEALPPPQSLPQKLLRQAFIGWIASLVSDTISNSLRVLKTYRQVNQTRIGYREAAQQIIAAEGWTGLLGRGLPVRLLCNGLQSIMFSVLWKLFQDALEGKGAGVRRL